MPKTILNDEPLESSTTAETVTAAVSSLAHLILPDDAAYEADEDQGSPTLCPIAVPNYPTYFRLHPTVRITIEVVYTQMPGKNRDEFFILLNPALRADVATILRRTALILGVDQLRQPFWYATYPRRPDQKSCDWWTTALVVAEEAQKSWVTRFSAGGHYEKKIARDQEGYGEPRWPTLTKEELLDLAFDEQHRVRDETHPLIRQIRGEVMRT